MASPSGGSKLEEIQALCFDGGSDLKSLPYKLGSNSSEWNASALATVSAQANDEVVKLERSRCGRLNQRYARELTQRISDGREDALVRLTTGCVPILRNGKLMLISSKSGWAIPKGGWENDEDLCVGAIRETFEEAGVVGLLGPPLPSITYETKKARRRRAANGGSIEGLKSDELYVEETDTSLRGLCFEMGTNTEGVEHSHNHLTLFPLYVQRILPVWPENDRTRKVFSLEEATVALANRPELLAGLGVLRRGAIESLS